jgi:flagellar protein FliS
MGTGQEVTTYREMAVQTASPVELLIMLYDRLIADLKQASSAIRAHSIEERIYHSNHALDVLQQLDLMLNHEQGGSIAKELARVYSYVRAKLIEAQIKLDPAIVDRQMDFILQLRQAWQQSLMGQEVSATTRQQPDASSSSEVSTYPRTDYVERGSCSWSA